MTSGGLNLDLLDEFGDFAVMKLLGRVALVRS